MRSKVFKLLVIGVVLLSAAGCARVRFLEPEGATVEHQIFFLIWSKKYDIPVSPEECPKLNTNSWRKIRLHLPDGFTIYGTMELKGEEYFAQYGAIPIRLTQSEVIDPIKIDNKIITYVVYEPWIGGKPPVKKPFPGILGYIGDGVSMFGTLWIGERAKGKKKKESEVEKKGQKVVDLYAEDQPEGPTGDRTVSTATIVGVGDDPIAAAKKKGKILVILRLGNRKRSKW